MYSIQCIVIKHICSFIHGEMLHKQTCYTQEMISVCFSITWSHDIYPFGYFHLALYQLIPIEKSGHLILNSII